MGLYDWEAREVFLEIGQKEIKPQEFFGQYRVLVKEYVHYRNRLKNPISLRDGKPLARSYINQFESRASALRKHLKAYKVVTRWLIICGYLKGRRKKELSTEQDLIKYMLQDYVREQKDLEKYRSEYRSQKYWKDQVERWKERAKFWEKESKEWSERCLWWSERVTGKRDKADPQEVESPKPCKVYPFKIVDGGKQFEEQPPFAN